MARDKRTAWRLVAALGAFAIMASACASDDEPDADDTAGEDTAADDGTAADDEQAPAGDAYCEDGGEGTLRWIHEQEPPDMQLDDPANNLFITSLIQQGMLEGLFGISSEMVFVPELASDEGEVVENEDGTFSYNVTLRDDIQFSDGTPITGQTVQDTFDIIVDEAFPHSDKADYQLIDPDGWEVDGQSVTFTMDTFFAGWQSLFERLYPTHSFEGDVEAADDALRTFLVDGEPLPASGPFQFAEWNEGVSMSLTRNDEYHGAHPDNPEITNTGPACVDGVEIMFAADTDALINGLRAGEADFIFTQPQVAFGEVLLDDPAIESAAVTSAAFEHWSLNIHNAHLSNPDVREALAYAMDKGVVMESLYTPIYGDALPAEGAGNSYWLTGSAYYEDHQGQQGYGMGDADAAAELLEGAGYELNSDGIYEHPELGPLSLRVGTTGGNQLRELQEQLLQDQLAQVGVDIQIDNVPGGDYFTERAFSPGHVACSVTQGDHGATVTLQSGDEATADCEIVDIAQFAWVGGPWPGGQNVAYRTGSENNPHGYSNPEVDALMDECDATVDTDERGACYNELDLYVTTRTVDEDGLIIIPLTVKPNFFAYSTATMQRAGTVVDANDAGPLAVGMDFLPAN